MSRERPIRTADNWFIGEDKIFEFIIDDGEDPPVVVDISTFALEFVLRRSASSPDPADITKSTGVGGITIIDGPNGVLQVIISDSDTINLIPNEYFYTIRQTNSGQEQVLAFGRAVLRQAATR